MSSSSSSPSPLTEVQRSIEAVAARVGPAVAGIGRGWALGSGVVVGRDRLLTSPRNLGRGEPTVSFVDGRAASAAVAGLDPDLDLAVLSVDTGEAAPVEWASAGAPGIGAPVVALANPGGRGLRATLGFVSAAGRSFRGPRGRRIEGAIEHTAPLPRGSSGGPLVDLDGRLLGLNAVRLEGGLILAVPATDMLRQRVELLARGDAQPRRRLGVAVASPRMARRMRRAVGLPERSGLLVRAVDEASPAGRAGIERGDLIVAAGDRDLDEVDALYSALDELPADARLPLRIVRGSDERDVAVTFEEQAA